MNDENKSRSQKKQKLWRIVLIVICVILALILAVIVTGAIYVERILNKIPRATEPATTLSQEQIAQIENGEDEEPEETVETEPGATAETVETIPEEEVTQPEDPVTLIQGDHLINILLIGQDRRPGESRARSDSMILCTFNLNDKTLTMTSFLRDLYVAIPGYQDNRMNAAYALGGMKLLNATLEKNFGVVVDGNVEVDFGEFQSIIDLLGGVDINLTSAEANYMGLSAGANHLNGEKALQYARIRKLDSDFGRTNRQRNVLNALIQAYRNKPLNEMLSLLDQILPIVTTDMSNAEIVGYAMEVFPTLAGCSISTQSIPASGTYKSVKIRGMSVLYPDLEENRQILVDTLLN